MMSAGNNMKPGRTSSVGQDPFLRCQVLHHSGAEGRLALQLSRRENELVSSSALVPLYRFISLIWVERQQKFSWTL